MIYFIAYFLLDHFDAPNWYFNLFWAIIVGEVLFAIGAGIVKGMIEK
jgi:hypothetical protein